MSEFTVKVSELNFNVQKSLKKVLKDGQINEKEALALKNEILKDHKISLSEDLLIKALTSDGVSEVSFGASRKANFEAKTIEFNKVEAKASQVFLDLIKERSSFNVEGKYTDSREDFFVTQLPSEFNNSQKSINGHANCGPSVSLMALRAFDFKTPNPDNANKGIEEIRKAVTKSAGAISTGQLALALLLKSEGKIAVTEYNDNTPRINYSLNEKRRLKENKGTDKNEILKSPEKFLAKMQEELAKGNFVVLLTNNMSMIESGTGTGGHYIVVTGIKDGKIQVADPGYKDGIREYDFETFKKAFEGRYRNKGNKLISINSK